MPQPRSRFLPAHERHFEGYAHRHVRPRVMGRALCCGLGICDGYVRIGSRRSDSTATVTWTRGRVPDWLPEGDGPRTGLIGQRSVEVLQCVRDASFDGRVPVGRGGGVRLGEKVPRPFGVAGSTALGEHRSPEEVGAGGEELGAQMVRLNAAAWVK